ncbi:cell surface protein [Philodulcilactobacillus myokoensis]|uniref:Cell surface protein n=1 Tax=Philodulcilactobacillus myokoensis TaxID=2929573 RepID=A0A9W6B376_9LACO|nr:CdaR family protein [Philodulcilactobacillus myokoensis]GLB47114.1 cell surface protein [Philodulcilactobacillus myokoensis]
MNKFFNSNFFFRCISLLFAILIFAYVKQTQTRYTNHFQSSNGQQTQLTSTKTDNIQVPLQLNVNSSKYFVTGYPEKVNVQISGPSALVTTTSNTQNFKVFADLSKLSVGKHNVRLFQEGLNSDLTYHLRPSTIKVDVQPRRTISMPIKVAYNNSNLSPGYTAGKPVAGISNVKVTGASSEISKIKRVIAQLNLPENTSKTVDTQAVMEALDSKNRIVNVILTPSTTTVHLPITRGNNKKVPLNFHLMGSNGHKSKVVSNVKNVNAFGSSQQLAKIKKVTVNVNASEISSGHEKTIQLDKSLNNVSGFNPDHIKIKIVNE